jgi:RND superfamily putative drug exporter
MVLVPASMALMGRANWWLPGWLDRLLPHVDLEDDGAARVPVVVPAQGQAPPVAQPARR